MIGIITSNFEEMLNFYKEVLGFKVQLQMEGKYGEFENEGVRFALSTNEVMADATGHPSYKQKRTGQGLELAFRVESAKQVDQTYREIVDKGATPIKEPADLPWGQRAAFFADPDGHIHEVFAELDSN